MKTWKARQITEQDAEIGFRIRQIRQQKNIPQIEIAHKLGVTFQQMQKYELGHNRITAARLLEIADILGVTPNEILGRNVDQVLPENVDRKIAALWQHIRSDRYRRAILLLLETIHIETRTQPQRGVKQDNHTQGVE
jgi:transcriptional regulator with XRE-family HTH domain